MLNKLQGISYKLFHKADFIGKTKSGISLYKTIEKDGTEVFRSFKNNKPFKVVKKASKKVEFWDKNTLEEKRFSIYNYETKVGNNVYSKNYTCVETPMQFGPEMKHCKIMPGNNMRMVYNNKGDYSFVAAGKSNAGHILVTESAIKANEPVIYAYYLDGIKQS